MLTDNIVLEYSEVDRYGKSDWCEISDSGQDLFL